jgi:hypothetical protein
MASAIPFQDRGHDTAMERRIMTFFRFLSLPSRSRLPDGTLALANGLIERNVRSRSASGTY